MADDINLPNLISHLQVNLGNTSGLVADATRQGSSVGAALGDSMQRTLRAATDSIPPFDLTADSTDLDRDLHRVRGELDELANQRIGVDISIEDALRQMERLQPHLERLQRSHPSVLVQAQVSGALTNLTRLRDAARRVDDTDVDIDVDIDDRGLRRRLEGVTTALGRVGAAAASLGSVAALGLKAGVAIGALLPLVAGLATALANIAPAAAVAATGFVALQLATQTLKLGMQGVGDAVKAALDPGTKPEELAKALENLAPEARKTVIELGSMRDRFKALQLGVQNRLFKDFDEVVRGLGDTVLPRVRTALNRTAVTFNEMGIGVAKAAVQLSNNGTLGIALAGATKGLQNLVDVPAQATTAVGQLAAAAAPGFDRITKAVARVATAVSGRLDKAFQSGAMEGAINAAIDAIAQLGRVIGNVFGGLGNVFDAVSTGGEGLFGMLERVSQAFEDLTATKDFQDGLRALVETMTLVSRTVLPLLSQALQIVGRVFVTLSKPLQSLVTVIGGALGRVLTGLEPVLIAVAGAFGTLLGAAAPIVDLAADLLVALLPALVPLFENLGRVIAALTPVITAIAQDLAALLIPILASIAPILEIILPAFAHLAEEILPLFADVLVQLAPSLQELGVALADLLISLAPLIPMFVEFIEGPLARIIEEGSPLLVLAFKAMLYGLTTLVNFVTDVAVPSLMIIANFLTGDFQSAWDSAGQMVQGFRDRVTQILRDLNAFTHGALGEFATTVITKGNEGVDEFVRTVRDGVYDAAQFFATLPQRIAGAMGDMGGLLYRAGTDVIDGFVSGIQSKIDTVRSTLGNLTAMIPNWKGPKRKDAQLLTPAGRSIIKSLIDGIDGSTAALKSKLTAITNLIERAITINAKNRKKIPGLAALLARVEADNKKLTAFAKQRDSIATKLKAAQTKLSDALKQRSAAAAQIRDGILGEANITTGNSVVNSVSAITIGLQQAAAKAKAFAANLLKLRKAGLRTDLLDDIAAAGVDGGAATAEALAKATPAELKRINDLQGQLAKSAGSAGSTVAGAMYDAGVKAAQGLVDGLKKQQSAIEKQMEAIGKALLKALRKTLDIHSPSRRARQIGVQFMEGMPLGFEDMRQTVIRAAASVANGAANAASAVASVTPRLPVPGQLSTAYAGAGTVGATTNNFYLQGGDATPDGILRALSWRGLIGRSGR